MTRASDAASDPSAQSQVTEMPFIDVLEFPSIAEINHGALYSLSLSNDTSYATHGLHRFPAKFIPQVPRWAMSNLVPDDGVVVDPFMGSGTTLVEALLLGKTALGIDLDPLACLLGRAKTSIVDPHGIAKLGLQLIGRPRPRSVPATPPMSDLHNFDHWFTADAWSSLQALLGGILTADCSASERTFLLAVFSSVIRRVSKADDQSHKTYVSGTRPKEPPEATETFRRHLERAVEGLKRLATTSKPGRVTPATGDARRMPLRDGCVDLIVTSPPYLDSLDYMYNFMLEYFWLGPLLGVPNRRAFNLMRKEYLGAKAPNRISGEPVPIDLAAVWPEIARGTPSVQRMRSAVRYFHNMSLHFEEASRVLKPGGRYVLVIGNSQTRSGILPVHDCLTRLAERSGLELGKAFGYRIRRHYMKFPRNGNGGIILIDWVLTFTKVDGLARPARPLPLPWAVLSPDSVAN